MIPYESITAHIDIPDYVSVAIDVSGSRPNGSLSLRMEMKADDVDRWADGLIREVETIRNITKESIRKGSLTK